MWQVAVSGAVMGRSPEKVSSEQRLEEVRCTQVLFMEKGSDGGGSRRGRRGAEKDDMISTCGVKVPGRRQKRRRPAGH